MSAAILLAKRKAGVPLSDAERVQRAAAAKARWSKQARIVYRGTEGHDPTPSPRHFGAVFVSPYERNARGYAWVSTTPQKSVSDEARYNKQPTMNRYRLADDIRVATIDSPEWNAILDQDDEDLPGRDYVQRWRDRPGWHHDPTIVSLSPGAVELGLKMGVHAMESHDPSPSWRGRKRPAELVVLDPTKLIFEAAEAARRLSWIKDYPEAESEEPMIMQNRGALMRKRAPLTQAEHAERSVAGRASAEARHRAETSPSVKQGSTSAPSRQAVGLFRQGQSRPDTRASRSAWDTRATEAPVGSTNATFTFHFPKAYREKPDRPRLSPKTLALATAGMNEAHHGVVITNPKQLAEAHRHKTMREIIENTIGVVRDHQAGTIERGYEKGLIPEGTRPGTVARAYKHAALHALHKAGLGAYDTKMDDEAKAEFTPLVPFIRYAHRRVFDHLNQAKLQGKWKPFRDEYGQLFRQKFHGKYTGKERMRMRPTEFIKIDLVDGDLEKGRWTHYSLKDGFKDDGVPTAGNDSPHALARKAVVSHALGKPIPEPPGGVPPIAGASIKEASQGVERHFGSKEMDVPRIGGCTRKEASGLYRVLPLEDLEKVDYGFRLSDFTTDPKRQLARAMRPRMRHSKVRLRLNTQRNLRHLLNGGVTREERWQLGATMGKFDETRHKRDQDGRWSAGHIAAGAALGLGALATAALARKSPMLVNRRLLMTSMREAAVNPDTKPLAAIRTLIRNRKELRAHASDLINKPVAVGKTPTGKELRRHFVRHSYLGREASVLTDDHRKVIAMKTGNAGSVDMNTGSTKHRFKPVLRTYHNHPIDLVPSAADISTARRLDEDRIARGLKASTNIVYGHGTTDTGKTRVRVTRHDGGSKPKNDAEIRELLGSRILYQQPSAATWDWHKQRGSNYRTKAVEKRWQLGATMGKAYDRTKHPREHDGKFSSKPAERAARFVAGAGGALVGGVLGLQYGAKIGDRIGLHAGHAVGLSSDFINYIRSRGGTRRITPPRRGISAAIRGAKIGTFIGGRYGAPIGAAALGLGGVVAGSEIGAQIDRFLARRRAKKAGKLDQWKRLNAGVSVRPNNRKQLRRAIGGAVQAGKRVHRIHRSINDLMMAEPAGDLQKGLLAGIAGAAAAGGAAHLLATGLQARQVRAGAAALYRTGLKDAVRQHLHVFEGGSPSPHVAAGQKSAFRGAKAHALKVAMAARKKGLGGISTKGVTAGAALVAGQAGLRSGGGYTMPPLYQSAAQDEQPE